MKLKILSFNIHKGQLPRNRGSNIEILTPLLKSLDLDIILLQESCDHMVDEEESQCCKIAKEIGLDHKYGLNASKEDSNHGNVTLCNFPVIDAYNLNLTASPLEFRGSLYTKFKVGNEVLHVFNTHFSLTFMQRRKQFNLLKAHIDSVVPEGEKVLIGGDFNDFRGRIHHLMKEAHYQDVFEVGGKSKVATFPSHNPHFMLDHIYFKNMQLDVCELKDEDPWREISDHLGIYCEFTF